MAETIVLLNDALQYMENFYVQYHPQSLWLMSSVILCLTHLLSVVGFRPICTFIFLSVILHVFNYIKPVQKIVMNTHQMLLNDIHEQLQELKSQNINIYRFLVGSISCSAILIYISINSFYECYVTMILLFFFLQYKYELLWTNNIGNNYYCL